MNERKPTNDKNELTETEKKEMNTLLDKAHRTKSERSVEVSQSETERAYDSVRSKIKTQKKSRPPYLKYAAAALILIGLVGIGYLLTPQNVSVPNGSTQTLTLADGTAVTLNSGSSLSYPRWFNVWGRTVSLEGEAFFDVTTSGVTFTVETNNAVVKVTGTKFNVRSWPKDDENKTSLFLQEGKVSFSSKTGKEQTVILNPGETSWLSGEQPIPVQPKKTERTKALAWMQNGLSFQNQPLSVIFKEITRRFDVLIETENKRILEERLTIYLSKLNTAEQTVADICRAKNLVFTQEGDTFTVTGQ